MSWLNLLPRELEPGDHWSDDDPPQIVESVEPVESPSHCRIIFEDGTDLVWPWEAPRRIWRMDEWKPLWEDTKPKPEFL